jgi:hypothetical protein
LSYFPRLGYFSGLTFADSPPIQKLGATAKITVLPLETKKSSRSLPRLIGNSH